jgi:hypothetical protein
MMHKQASRTFAAYLAGVTVLAGLLYVVTYGGSSIRAIGPHPHISAAVSR